MFRKMVVVGARDIDGTGEGCVGTGLGKAVGAEAGLGDGSLVGSGVGALDGLSDGTGVGPRVGAAVGRRLG